MLTLLAVVVATACQPEDETPGLWLRGETAEEKVADWSFSDEIEEIFIETRPWYGIPHSTTIWCVALDGGLYIGSYGDQKKVWERNIERDPEARLSITGRIYDVTLAAVTDGDLIEALDAAYARKYDMVEVFGEEIPDWRYYRVAQRGPHYSGIVREARRQAEAFVDSRDDFGPDSILTILGYQEVPQTRRR